MKRVLLSLCLALATQFISDAKAAPAALCEREIHTAALKANIPAGVLLAVGLTETGHKGRLWPWAVNIAGKSHYPRTQAAAIRLIRSARARGVTAIDLGCMQISHRYHGQRFSALKDMINPRRNVRYAASFLAELRKREGNWTMAVARYHAGPDNDPAQKRYICRVIRNMIRTGFADWTRSARTFCKR